MRLDFRGAKHKAHLLIVRAIFRLADCKLEHNPQFLPRIGFSSDRHRQRLERKEPAFAFGRAQPAGVFGD